MRKIWHAMRAGWTAVFGTDWLFALSFLVMVVTCFFHVPDASAIDWKVLICLFGLMVVVKGFENLGVLRAISFAVIRRCRSRRGMLLVSCLLAFFCAMFLTNDVAIMTLLPILFGMCGACGLSMQLPAALVAVAANLGSAATPFGNPQNLFLFSHYDLSVSAFFQMSLPFALISLALVVCAALLPRSAPLQVRVEAVRIKDKKSLPAFGLAAALVILSVLGLFPYPAVLPLVLLVALIFQRNALKQVDYRLLGTFACLFIAIDNLSAIPSLRQVLAEGTGQEGGEYWAGIALSQFISNVPCAVLLAPFTTHVRAVFWGVNAGGLGTLIASMANLIAYRIFVKEAPEQ
ncbi:MAG TPA: SLC13 family permease, partial [Clostridia bacterium]|nr:SLC13 family permease [Clostridia bacterium]